MKLNTIHTLNGHVCAVLTLVALYAHHVEASHVPVSHASRAPAASLLSGLTPAKLGVAPSATVALTSSAPIVPGVTLTLSAQLPAVLQYEDNGAIRSAPLQSATFDVVTDPLTTGPQYQSFTVVGAQGSFGPVVHNGITVSGVTFTLAKPGPGRIEYSRGVLVASIELMVSAPGYPSVRIAAYTTGRVLSSTAVSLLLDGDCAQLGSGTGESFCVPGQNAVMPCPCGNPPAPSNRGCDNSSATGGAQLTATGLASLTTGSDTAHMTCSGEKPTALSILLSGAVDAPVGLQFGQGVRCVSGALKRLYVHNAVGGTVTVPEGTDRDLHTTHAMKGDPLSPGNARYYQSYYRDPTILGACPTADTFNVSNGQYVVWAP
jgi:hypothetical protein